MVVEVVCSVVVAVEVDCSEVVAVDRSEVVEVDCSEVEVASAAACWALLRARVSLELAMTLEWRSVETV